MASATSTTSLEVGLGDGKELSQLDIKSSFVTVSVDSNRINATFEVILKALQDVRVTLSNVCTLVDDNKTQIDGLKDGLADLTKKWEEDPRIAALNEKTANHDERIAKLEGQLATLTSRMDNLNQRMSAQESKRVDFSPLEDKIKALKAEMVAMGEKTDGLVKTTTEHTSHFGQIGADIDSLRKAGAETAKKLKDLYTILEMSEAQVAKLCADPEQHKQRGDTGACGLTEYVIGLPSFQTFYRRINDTISGVEKALTADIQSTKKKLAEESAQLRAKIGDKLDQKKFDPFKLDTEAAIKKLAGLEPRLDKLSDEVDTKASQVTLQKMYDHLDQVKADKSDLVGLLHRDDIIPLEEDIKKLAAAIDSSGAKLRLELRDRPRSPPPVEVKRRSSEDDKAIVTRIVGLEQGVQTLKEEKVGKEALSDVYLYIDNNLAKLQNHVGRMPTVESSTPGITPEGPDSRPTSGKKRLAPLLRPPSAGGKREDTVQMGSIPETVRSPSPPITYTSSPAKYVPNMAKYRATASVFDSEGSRTLATVTASHVPAVDHWHNVARSAAGEEVIPSSMRTHSME